MSCPGLFEHIPFFCQMKGNTSMEFLHTDKAPAALGPYSQAVEAGGFVYTSGQLGIIPATGELAVGVEAQTDNIKAIMTAGLRNG